MWSVSSPAARDLPVNFPLEFNSSITSSVDSFLKDGREIRVGDCALFQSGNAPPFIGIIRWFTTSKGDCLKLCVNWLYRPADVKLAKGILLEAAPNEVFYSFHKDVISSSSLLHPCKVAFLGKGVELPLGISSFICRRVYDIANKCLWWLTDQDFIDERQEEVDQLLYKTRLEMHAGVQSGARSPKSLNGSSSIPQINSGTDSVQNSGTSFPAQVRGKKRNRGGDQGTEPIKRVRPTKLEDGGSASSRLDNMIKAEIAKFTEKGALITTDSVEKLVHLIQLDRKERKIDFACRILLADLIAATDKIECLAKFVQLRGVPVLDDWLQEARKGKSGDGITPKDTDKGTEELLLALLRALDKLPVNLNALQTCNIGKSVNHLRGHKNIEVQKKARSLVDTWKKRVDAEMTKINDPKSVGSNQAASWPVKQGFPEVFHEGSRLSGSAETTAKNPINQTSTCKTLVSKPGHADAIVKSTPVTPGLLKLPSTFPASVSISPKDSPGKGTGSSGNSELLLAGVKEEKSSGSSQSQNNSQSYSSDHAKAMNSPWKEDARSSTAGSMNANRTSGGSSRHRRSTNGYLGSSILEAQKEANLGKTGSPNQVSNQTGLSFERTFDTQGADHGVSHRLIVRLPNPGRSPARSASGGSLVDPSVTGSGASSPGPPDKYEHTDRKIKLKGDTCRSHISTDVNAESWQSNGVKECVAGCDEGDRSPATVLDASRAACLSSVNGKGVSLTETKSRNSCSSMNALIVSCAKYSEASASLSSVDDVGINLLANVAAGEISKSDLASPSASPGSSPKEEPCAASNEVKSRLTREDGERPEETNAKEELEGEDNKTIDYTCEKIAEGSTKASSLADNMLDGRDNGIGTGKISEKSGGEDDKEVPNGATFAEPPQPLVTENHADASNETAGDAIPSSNVDEVICSKVLLVEARSHATSPAPDVEAKLDFDLNEGFSGDDINQAEHTTSSAPVYSTATRLCAPITVAAAIKGPFMPPESIMKGKGGPGWRGSAATSAFRPVLERSLNKQVRPSLDIDLNVPDEGVHEDVASQSSPARSCGGLDLDLNKVDEGTPRDFDLNNGPGVDGVGVVETLRKSSIPFLPQISSNSYPVGDIYRGPVLSSSPAMAFPYAGFPFGSTFPAIPSQFVGPGGGVSSPFARPYMVSHEEGSTNRVAENSRKWGRHGLDLSAQVFMDEQARMYQMSGVKRKEGEGGSWDERYYKHPSWQ